MKADPTFLYTWTRLNDSLPSPLFDNLLSLSSTTFCVKKKKGRRRNTGIVIEHADMIISRIMTYIMWITRIDFFFFILVVGCWDCYCSLLLFLSVVIVVRRSMSFEDVLLGLVCLFFLFTLASSSVDDCSKKGFKLVHPYDMICM